MATPMGSKHHGKSIYSFTDDAGGVNVRGMWSPMLTFDERWLRERGRTRANRPIRSRRGSPGAEARAGAKSSVARYM